MNAREFALERLATPQADTRFHQSYLPREIATRTGCSPGEAQEALWGLVADGLAFIDQMGQQSPDNWWWRITDVGRRAAAGGSWEPRDVDGFLSRLKAEVPSIEPGALVYLNEALRAFGARCFLSASVMLGVAAEHVFTGLARAVVGSVGRRGDRLREALDNPKSSRNARFGELRKVLEPLRPQLPRALTDALTLDSVADLLRVARNDAGHPTGVLIDEITARTHLAVAAGYLGKLTELRLIFERDSFAGPSTRSPDRDV